MPMPMPLPLTMDHTAPSPRQGVKFTSGKVGVYLIASRFYLALLYWLLWLLLFLILFLGIIIIAFVMARNQIHLKREMPFHFLHYLALGSKI